MFKAIYEFWQKLFRVNKEKTEELKQSVTPTTSVDPINPTNKITPYGVAKTQIGQIEKAGPESNPQVLKYFAATKYGVVNDDSQVPWCSAFVCYCFSYCQLPNPKSAWARSWLSWGEGIKEKDVIEGDIVVFDRGNRSGHVGFVVKINATTVEVLGGNQSDSVNVTKYNKSKVLGYRRANQLHS